MSTPESEPGAIYAAMIAVLKDLPAVEKVPKDAGKDIKYPYHAIDRIYGALQKLCAKHGVFCVPRVVSDHATQGQTTTGKTVNISRIHMAHRFYASDGSFVESTTVGEAFDSGDKDAGKAQTYAHKVALIQAFMVSTPENYDTETQHFELMGGEESGRYASELLERDKTDLLIATNAELTRAGSALGPKKLLHAVCMDIFGHETMENRAEVDKVREALRGGKYDLDTGERIPDGI